MTASAAPIDVGEGYAVEFSLSARGVECEWSPDLPPADVGQRLLPEYRRARDSFLAALSSQLGKPIAVVDG